MIALQILAERPELTDDEHAIEALVSVTGSVRTGVVIEVGRRRCVVEPFNDASAKPVACLLSPDLAARQHEELAVGDHAEFVPTEERDQARLVRVLPRTSALSRPDPRRPGRLRVVVANVDVVVVVVSIASPPLHPRLIDRFLMAVERGGARAVVCINKIDLRDTPEASDPALLDPYRAMGVQVIETSPTSCIGIDTLKNALAGTTCAFVGHSGVGKSSLVNAMDPQAQAEVGGVSDSSGRGRHTTTRSSMHVLDNGTRIIDTPGVRSFSVEDLTNDDIRAAFTEFVPFAEACHFRDCTHSHEPDCAVREAAASGDISSARYDTYRRMIADGGEGRPDRVGHTVQ